VVAEGATEYLQEWNTILADVAAKGGGAGDLVLALKDPAKQEQAWDAAKAGAGAGIGFAFLPTAISLRSDLQEAQAAESRVERLKAMGGDAKALPTVLENADEVHALGELLLDLRDRKRLLFTESEVEPDLRFAVRLLGESQRGRRDLQTMQAMVAPALRSSRLAAVSRTIAPVQLDRGEEMEVLQRLTAQRPDIFPKLFIVIGSSSGLDDDFAMLRSGTAFRFDDDCGPSWVAPRSEVESREGVWRWVFDRSQNGAAKVRVAPK
jgi:hypothetical protein